MAKLILHAPMARMLGIPVPGFHIIDFPLQDTVSLEEFFQKLSQINPNFSKVLAREHNTYFEQIRLFVDGVMAVSDDYTLPVHEDSEVALLPPYVDG